MRVQGKGGTVRPWPWLAAGLLALGVAGCQWGSGGGGGSTGDGAPLYNPTVCEPTGTGRDYRVGPGQTYESVGAVPWSELGPGDTVRIFWREEPYREKILIHTSGTEDEPLRVCGVAGPDGERPVLDGDGAVNPASQDAAYGGYLPMQALALVLVYDSDYERKPAHIVIEGLHLRNARTEFSLTNTRGDPMAYEDGAACIRVQAADDVRIRNNEIENCGNGIFTMSQTYNEAALTRDVLVEGNDIHGNGQPGSYLEHGVYVQAIGATYQFNRFGPNAPGAQGATLKERVAGSVIRYNWFDAGSTRVLDLVEVEDSAPWFLETAYRDYLEAGDFSYGPGPDYLDGVRAVEAQYRTTYVYGNLIRHVGSETPAGNLIHYGYDNDPAYARGGTLYFYDNTLVLLNDRDDSWRLRLFDLYPYDEAAGAPAGETVEAFNNIVYVAAETEGAEPSYFCLGRDSGTIRLGVNWISTGWAGAEVLAECYPYAMEPTITGEENLVDTAGEPVPVDLETLEPRDLASVRDRGQALPGDLERTHPVDVQYVRHLRSEPRSGDGDLGALALP